ncbi:siderophore-interacting protein [Flexibacterium corallicola]|uniref:siderophore-interacting protein n=1 Tax=Flexibacterium corallicola TaxID=3037259 RepID=UPI00286EBFCA|nr:siderophore-interacting protein [Pseudovibrio sp. M1P-2-3]
MLSVDPVIFKLETSIVFLPPLEALKLFEAEAKEHNLAFTQTSESTYRAGTQAGVIDFRVTDSALDLKVSSPSKDALYLLKESIDAHIVHFTEGRVKQAWQGDLPAGALPPNFTKATVLGAEAFTCNFMRVTLRVPDIERFSADALHFRLLFPKKRGVGPQWPFVDENGRTVWPEGDKELMRQVYTVRSFNKAQSTFDLDVFMHEDGPTSEWASRVSAGDEVGLLGPSGGVLPKEKFVLFAGDETAFPAICRTLLDLPKDTCGKVLLMVSSEKDERFVVDAPEGMDVEWVLRDGQGQDVLLEAAKTVALEGEKDSFVWFAANKELSKKARKYFRNELGYTAKNSYIAGYWE